MSEQNDVSDAQDWRRVALALASVTRPLALEDELREGWHRASDKARLAEADAQTELQRADRAEADARNAWAEVDTLTVRLEAAEAARAQAEARALQTYTQMDAEATRDRFEASGALDPETMGRFEAERGRILATLGPTASQSEYENAVKQAWVVATKLAPEGVSPLSLSQKGAAQALQYEIKFLSDRLLCAQRDRDAAIETRRQKTGELARTQAERNSLRSEVNALSDERDRLETEVVGLVVERDQYRVEMLHGTSEIKSLRAKNKELEREYAAEQERRLAVAAEREVLEARLDGASALLATAKEASQRALRQKDIMARRLLEAESALLDARLQQAEAKAADPAARPTVEGVGGDDASAEDTSACDPIIENSWLIGDLREQLAAMTAARDAAFRRGAVAERSAVVRLLNDLRAKATDADQKDGLGRIVGTLQSGGHVAARRGET